MILLIILYSFVYTKRYDNPNQEYYRVELFELGPFLRLLFSMVFISYASALLIYFWQRHEINYIHLMEINYKNRLNYFQLWKVASILFFVFLFLLYQAIQEMETIYHNFAKEEISEDD